MLLLEWEGVIGIASVIPLKETPAVLNKTDSPSILYSMYGYIKFINLPVLLFYSKNVHSYFYSQWC